MGQPTSINLEESPTESIGRWKTTQGSEPSQYPEEEKAIAIPPVAASEQGTAQTFDVHKPAGVASRVLQDWTWCHGSGAGE